MERLAAAPTTSVPKACNDWGETMAVYRFFANEDADWRVLLEPHWQQTETCPDLDAQLFFDPDEIQATYLLHNKVPPAVPRLNEALRQTACLGGFHAKKDDGESAVKTICLGLKDIHVAVRTMRALRRLSDQKTCV